MKVTINIEKRYAFVIISLILVGIVLAGVVAYNTGTNANPSVFGHTSNEIAFLGDIAIAKVNNDIKTGRLATQGLTANCPDGTWACGVHSHDIWADYSVRANQICLGGTPGTNEVGVCKNTWPTGSGSTPATYTLEAQWVAGTSCPAGWINTNLKDCDLGDGHDTVEDSCNGGGGAGILCLRLVSG